MERDARIPDLSRRSGRVIAVYRLFLAAIFFVALWVDPRQPARYEPAGYLLLMSYVSFALAMMRIAWVSWWWDTILALPAYVADVFVFLFALYFTSTIVDDFISPYFASYVFLILAAAVRWDARHAAIVGFLIPVLYLLVAWAIGELEPGLPTIRFFRRAIYMTLIAVALVWFSTARGAWQPPRFVPTENSANGAAAPILREAVLYLADQTKAASAAIVWSDPEEPWIEFVTARDGTVNSRRLSPTSEENLTCRPFDDDAVLFSTTKRRALTLDRQGRIMARRGAIACPAAAALGVSQGITFPLYSAHHRGRVVLSGISGVCADDLQATGALRSEIQGVLDRYYIATLHEHELVSGVRDAIARDLHDSVAQSLAGAAFRLESIKKALLHGRDVTAEIDEAKVALRHERQNVRRLITQLQSHAETARQVDLKEHLEEVLPTVAAAWGVQVEVEPPSSSLTIGVRLAHEISQLFREAVANAVRHGNAKRISISWKTTASGDRLDLAIADDGRGFSDTGPAQPWSIWERAKALGGSLAVDTSQSGVRLKVSLPLANER